MWGYQSFFFIVIHELCISWFFDCIRFDVSWVLLALLEFISTNFKMEWIAIICAEDLCCWQWMKALSIDFQTYVVDNGWSFKPSFSMCFWNNLVLDFDIYITILTKNLHPQYLIFHWSLKLYYQPSEVCTIVPKTC